MVVPAVASALPARAEEAQVAAQEKRTELQTRLTEARLKACQSREKAITNLMTRLSDRGQRKITLFSTIASRTETFYTNKGKSLSNYDALVADVNAKKATAQTAVDKTKATAKEFNCNSTDPKGIIATFKNNLKAQNDALKAYKTAVKNLIVGVKSVQSTTSVPNTTGGTE